MPNIENDTYYTFLKLKKGKTKNRTATTHTHIQTHTKEDLLTFKRYSEISCVQTGVWKSSDISPLLSDYCIASEPYHSTSVWLIAIYLFLLIIP